MDHPAPEGCGALVTDRASEGVKPTNGRLFGEPPFDFAAHGLWLIASVK